MKEPSFSQPRVTEPGFTFGNLRLEPDGRLIRGDAEVHLPPKELAALRLLLDHAGEIVTPGQLKASLWADVHVTPDSISKCMSSLRSRLEPENCIQTVYKRGYRLKDEVRRDEAAQRTHPPRLAIVPFATTLNVPAHLGPGVAEEAAAYLSNLGVSSFSVLARDSVFALAERGMTAHQVGTALKGDLVLAGTLYALPLHLRLRVEMIRVADGVQIWSEDMLVSNDDPVALQSELTQRLTFRLTHSPELSATLRANEFTPIVTDSTAYDLFLRGHQEWQTMERHHMQDGAQHLLRATELDASFMAAQVDLVRACATQSLYGFLSPAVAGEQIQRVTDSNPYLTEDAPAVLAVLGWMNFHLKHDLAASLQNFARCASLPHDPCTTRMRVHFALSRHRFAEARAILEDALEVDPFAAWLHAELAWTKHLAGEFDGSQESLERALAAFPENEWNQLFGAIILAFHGETERALNLARKLVQQKPYLDMASAVHAYALACDGREAEARATLERLQWLGRERFVLSSFNPAVCVALGDLEGAVSELHASERVGCPWYFQMLADPRLKKLHGHAEFQAMKQRLARMEAGTADPARETAQELSFAP